MRFCRSGLDLKRWSSGGHLQNVLMQTQMLSHHLKSLHLTSPGILVCTRLAIRFSFPRPMCQLKRPSFPLNEVKTRRHFLCFPCRSCRSDLSHTNVRTPDSLVWRQETLLGTGDFVPPLTTKEPGGKWRSTSRSRAPLRGKDSVFKTHRCASPASPPELLKTKD